jgi:S-methylmethionine-dependent homocysteine/selenocysteine methylase
MTHLPQLGTDVFVTDGGMETTLIFHDGIDLPEFATFPLLRTEDGQTALRRYYGTYTDLAARYGRGLILESPTWRASTDWGRALGYDAGELADANRQAVRLITSIGRQHRDTTGLPVVLSGNVGPRGDGYVPKAAMSVQEAATFHAPQIEALAGEGVDMICAMTLNYVEEAEGIVRATQRVGLPVAISFTVETDGHLPTGQTLVSAIASVDQATDAYPAYYMLNCAHPDHFAHVVADAGEWAARLRGIRANASRRSHAELNDLPDLDAGDPEELGQQYGQLKTLLPGLAVVGGCCGTDHRHVEQMVSACA